MKMRIMLLAAMAIAMSLSSCGSFEENSSSKNDRKDITEHEIFDVSEEPAESTVSTENDKSDSIVSSVASSSEEIDQNNTVNNIPKLDPFDGLEVQFDGISPYANYTFNNSRCDMKIQQFVEYGRNKCAERKLQTAKLPLVTP